MPVKNKSEYGQVMIFIVVGFVIILGFVGLAIDGGRVYSDRRHAQNAADAASLAGGGAAALYMENSLLFYPVFDCNNMGSDPRYANAMKAARDAAIARALSNGFTIDESIVDLNGVTTTCGYDTSTGFVDKYIDVTVQISTTVETYFAQLVYGSRLPVNATAVTRVRPRYPLVYGHAIVALNQGPCQGNQNGTIFGGSSVVRVNGGGIFSNGCMGNNGGAFGVQVTNGTIAYAGTLESGSGNFSPPPIKAPAPMPPEASAVPLPNCSAPGVHTTNKITVSGNNVVTLEPGLWCVTGSPDAVKVTGGTIIGIGVTIYAPNGDIAISGNANIDLRAPDTVPDPYPAIPGLLFYAANGDIDMEGNNDSRFLGTLYAPNGTIKAHGTSGTHPTFNTQLIGNNVDVSGNALIDINFNQNQAVNIPSGVELNR